MKHCALRDRFVAGISNDKIKGKLLTEKDLTWDKACEVARNMEMAESNTNQMNGKGSVNYIRGRSRSRGRNQHSSGHNGKKRSISTPTTAQP